MNNIRKTLGVFVVTAACTPFLACNLLGFLSNQPPDIEPASCNDPTANPALFVDPADSTFCTTDVRDVDGEIVQFDPVAKTIIWAGDGTRFQEGQWDVNGNLLQGGGFTVAFGAEGGERRAYFTLTADGFICQIAVSGGDLLISGTTTPVPQE